MHPLIETIIPVTKEEESTIINFIAHTLTPAVSYTHLLVITIVLSYFSLVFGELVPKRIAMKKSESLALSLAGLLYAVSRIASPLVALLTVSTNGILRLLGIDPEESDEEVTEEEIRMMLSQEMCIRDSTKTDSHHLRHIHSQTKIGISQIFIGKTLLKQLIYNCLLYTSHLQTLLLTPEISFPGSPSVSLPQNRHPVFFSLLPLLHRKV